MVTVQLWRVGRQLEQETSKNHLITPSLHSHLKVTGNFAWRSLLQSLLKTAEAFLILMLYFSRIGSNSPQRLAAHFALHIPSWTRQMPSHPPPHTHTKHCAPCQSLTVTINPITAECTGPKQYLAWWVSAAPGVPGHLWKGSHWNYGVCAQLSQAQGCYSSHLATRVFFPGLLRPFEHWTMKKKNQIFSV